MIKLAALELRRNSLRPYAVVTGILGGVLLAFWYLMALIPRLDPLDPDAELFSTGSFFTGMNCTVCTAFFGVLGAVMAARLVVEEYSGKRVLLLFSYPVSRRRILAAKLLLVSVSTAAGMFLCGLAVQIVFFVSNVFFPFYAGSLGPGAFGQAVYVLLCDSLIAGLTAVLAAWVGLWRKSVPAAIVAGVVLVVLVCQVMPVTFFCPALLALFPLLFVLLAVLAAASLFQQVEIMEV